MPSHSSTPPPSDSPLKKKLSKSTTRKSQSAFGTQQANKSFSASPKIISKKQTVSWSSSTWQTRSALNVYCNLFRSGQILGSWDQGEVWLKLWSNTHWQQKRHGQRESCPCWKWQSFGWWAQHQILRDQRQNGRRSRRSHRTPHKGLPIQSQDRRTIWSTAETAERGLQVLRNGFQGFF